MATRSPFGPLHCLCGREPRPLRNRARLCGTRQGCLSSRHAAGPADLRLCHRHLLQPQACPEPVEGIERATYDSLAFRYLACNRHPDHDTLATFRRRFGTQFESVFVQVLQVAHENQVSSFGTVSLDSSSLRASARPVRHGYALDNKGMYVLSLVAGDRPCLLARIANSEKTAAFLDELREKF